MPSDYIAVRNLCVQSVLGRDSWERSKPQPILFSFRLYTSLVRSSENDTLVISYSEVAKIIKKVTLDSQFKSMEALAMRITQQVFAKWQQSIDKLWLRIEKPKVLLFARTVAVEFTREWNFYQKCLIESDHKPEEFNKRWNCIRDEDLIKVEGLELAAVVGVNDWERNEPQRVTIGLDIFPNTKQTAFDIVAKENNFVEIAKAVSKHVSSSKYKTVEALAGAVGSVALEQGVRGVRVEVDKPSAISCADAAGTSMTFWNSLPPKSPFSTSTGGCKVWLGMGSNLGDRISNLESAMAQLAKIPEITITCTAFLYETKPMYETQQPNFLNSVIEVFTLIYASNIDKNNIGARNTFRSIKAN